MNFLDFSLIDRKCNCKRLNSEKLLGLTAENQRKSATSTLRERECILLAADNLSEFGFYEVECDHWILWQERLFCCREALLALFTPPSIDDMFNVHGFLLNLTSNEKQVSLACFFLLSIDLCR